MGHYRRKKDLTSEIARINSQLARVEAKCDLIGELLLKLNRFVRGQAVDSLIETMRSEAQRMKELSQAENERLFGTA